MPDCKYDCTMYDIVPAPFLCLGFFDICIFCALHLTMRGYTLRRLLWHALARVAGLSIARTASLTNIIVLDRVTDALSAGASCTTISFVQAEA